jgi:antitoxin PrlF
MDIVKVTTKGQVTLPARVRKSLGISDQSYLVAEEIGGFLVLRKVEAELDEITGRFQRFARKKGITREGLARSLREARRRTGRP